MLNIPLGVCSTCSGARDGVGGVLECTNISKKVKNKKINGRHTLYTLPIPFLCSLALLCSTCMLHHLFDTSQHHPFVLSHHSGSSVGGVFRQCRHHWHVAVVF